MLDRITQLFEDRLTSKSILRDAEAQRKVDLQASHLALYQFPSCPFCIRVGRAIKRLNLDIETRDIRRNEHWRAELKGGGGKIQVPCLKITADNGSVEWMYESRDIVNYLTRRFSNEQRQHAS